MRARRATGVRQGSDRARWSPSSLAGVRGYRRSQPVASVAVAGLHRLDARDIRLPAPVRRLADGEPLRPPQRVPVLAADDHALAVPDQPRPPGVGGAAHPGPRAVGPTRTIGTAVVSLRLRHRRRQRDDVRWRDGLSRVPREPLGGTRLLRALPADAPSADAAARGVAALAAPADEGTVRRPRRPECRPRPCVWPRLRVARTAGVLLADPCPRQRRQPQPVAVAGLGVVADGHRAQRRAALERQDRTCVDRRLALPVSAVPLDARARARLAS